MQKSEGKRVEKRSRKLWIRNKRRDEEYRMKERIRDRERKRKLRQNEDYVRMERERDAERKRMLRTNEEYRQRERERDMKRKRELRENEQYRMKERERNREWKRMYRKKEYLRKHWKKHEEYRLEAQFLKLSHEQEERYLLEMLKGEIAGRRETCHWDHSNNILIPKSFLIPEVIVKEL